MVNLFDTGIRPAIDDYLLAEAAKVRDYGNYWSASSAGYCMRRNIFERLKVPHSAPEDARKQRVFTSGHIFHDWIQGITKEAGLSIASEVELQDEDLMVRGHFDDLVLVKGFEHNDEAGSGRTEHLILYDYKTVNSRAFLWAKKNGNAMSYYHKMQLGTYMYMLRNGGVSEYDTAKGGKGIVIDHDGIVRPTNNLTEARILKIEKDTLMMMEQQLMWSPELEAEVLTYWTILNEYWAEKKIPPCTCADYEGGFLAKEAYNNFFYEGEPCSLKYYERFKKGDL